jgi:hypothetical protein
MNLLSNDVKLHPNDWTFLKLSAVEREIGNNFCEISRRGWSMPEENSVMDKYIVS